MKKVDIIIFVAYLFLIALYPIEKISNFMERGIFGILMILYPIYYFFNHKLISHMLKIYVKDYIEVILSDIEKKAGKDFVNKIIIDVIFPFNIYCWDDLYKLMENIIDYIYDYFELSEQDEKQLIDYISSNKFDDYIKRIQLQKRMNSLKGIDSSSPWDILVLKYLNFYAMERKIWKYMFPSLDAVLFFVLLIFDTLIVITNVTLKLILLETILTLVGYLIYIIKNNKMYVEHFYFIAYGMFNMMVNLIFVAKDMSRTVYTQPLALILFSINYLLSIAWNNRIINIMFNIKGDKIYSNRKSKSYFKIDNLLCYKWISKMKYGILWVMFIIIIAFNILDFSFINYINLNGNMNSYSENIDLLIMCIKHSLSNYFTNTPIINFKYQNDFLINITQIILSYFTNVLLIANIVKYLTAPRK